MLIVDLLLLLLFVFATGGEQRSANQSMRLENENETGIDVTDRWQWIEDQVSNNSIQADRYNM